MKKFLFLLLLLAVPLAAQTPKCSQSRNTRLVTKASQWVSGVLKTWYVSADSVTATCTGFPVLHDTVTVLRVDTVRTVVHDTVQIVRVDTVYVTSPPPPPPPDTTPTPPPPPPPSGTNSLYFNSAEAGCGTDGNVLLCDDFEDGDWYTKDGDHTNGLETDGWYGTIYANPITPPGAAVCGSRGVKSNCAATHRGGNMAEHNLASAADEIWVRFYTKVDPGYTWGAEKVLTFNRTTGGGIYFGNVHFNMGSGGGANYGRLQWQGANGGQSMDTGYDLKPTGNWYYIEIHVRKSPGLLEMYADDCGPTGASCPATPTLRGRNTAQTWASGSFGALWWEWWSNPSSSGIRYIDQIKVSKSGPIGFMR